MDKRVVVLMTLVSMLLIGTAGAITWTGGVSPEDSAWMSAGNWDENRLPTAADQVNMIDQKWGASLWDPNAVCKDMRIAVWGFDGSLGIGTTGTLHCHGDLNIGVDGAQIGAMSCNGQITFEAGKNLLVGHTGVGYCSFGTGANVTTNILHCGHNGNGFVTIDGGTVTVDQFMFGKYGVGKGYFRLNGGEVTTRKLDFGPSNAKGLMDVEDGTITISGDYTATANYLKSIARIQAYGGWGDLVMDYGVTTPGKTTVTAVDTNMDLDPVKVWWNGASDGEWGRAKNWVPEGLGINAIPREFDQVVIQNPNGSTTPPHVTRFSQANTENVSLSNTDTGVTVRLYIDEGAALTTGGLAVGAPPSIAVGAPCELVQDGGVVETGGLVIRDAGVYILNAGTLIVGGDYLDEIAIQIADGQIVAGGGGELSAVYNEGMDATIITLAGDEVDGDVDGDGDVDMDDFVMLALNWMTGV